MIPWYSIGTGVISSGDASSLITEGFGELGSVGHVIVGGFVGTCHDVCRRYAIEGPTRRRHILVGPSKECYVVIGPSGKTKVLIG